MRGAMSCDLIGCLVDSQVEGMTRKNNYHGRWDVLFDQANDCLRKMLETATKRYKNYILDQVSTCATSTPSAN